MLITVKRMQQQQIAGHAIAHSNRFHVCASALQCGHIDEQAERNACSSSKAQVPSYPTQEKEDLLWVWGETGAQAFIHAFATPTCHNELFASFPEGALTLVFPSQHCTAFVVQALPA